MAPNHVCYRCFAVSRRYIGSILYSPTYTALLLALTLYSLYGDDARIAAVPAEYDYIFVIFTSITLVAFFTEIVMQAVAKDGYFPLPAFFVGAPPRLFPRQQVPVPTSPSLPTPPVTPQLSAFGHNNVVPAAIVKSSRASCWTLLPTFLGSLVSYLSIGSFALWIDLASTISVALEITVILHGSTSEQGLVESSTSGAWISLARAGRASRAGARIGRLLQLLRLWRLFRSHSTPTVQRQETRVGSQLTDLMTRRVVVGVLLCVLVIPPLSYTPVFSTYKFIAASALAFSAGAAASNSTALSISAWNTTLITSAFVEQGSKDLPALGSLHLCGPYSLAPCTSALEETIAAPLNRWVAQEIDDSLAFLSVSGFAVNLQQDEPFNFDVQKAHAQAIGGLRMVEHLSLSSAGFLTARAYCGLPPPSESLVMIQLPAASCRDGTWIVAVYLTELCPTSDCVAVKVDCTFSRVSIVREAALWSTGMTTLVVLVLAAGAALFSYDINRIVLRPLEYMIRVVQQISDNPLVQGPNVSADMQVFSDKGETTRQHAASMEVKLLLRTLLNIGSLLRMSFGESGAKIITNRLNNAKELNPVGPGKRVHGIFVFVQLQHMPAVMAALREETLLFVNFIADVVHAMAVKHRGIVVNNTSDGFVLMWTLPMEEVAEVDATPIADQAMLCVLRIFFDLAVRQQELWLTSAEGRTFQQPSASAAERFAAAFPGCNLSNFVGASCHCGWALEGPLGSDRKLDAAWISPHITFTRRLASALLLPNFSKALPLRVVVTHPLYALLSPRLRTAWWWITRVGISANKDSRRGFEPADGGQVPPDEPVTASGNDRLADLTRAFFGMGTFAMLTKEFLLSNISECPRADPLQVTVNDVGKLCVDGAVPIENLAAIQRIFVSEVCVNSYKGVVDVYSLCLPDDVYDSLSRNEDVKMGISAMRNIRKLLDNTKDDFSNRFSLSPRLRAMSNIDTQPKLPVKVFYSVIGSDASIVELIINMQNSALQPRPSVQMSLQQSLWSAYIENDSIPRIDSGPTQDREGAYARFCNALASLNERAQAHGFVILPSSSV
jgi:hypothetical protein